MLRAPQLRSAALSSRSSRCHAMARGGGRDRQSARCVHQRCRLLRSLSCAGTGDDGESEAAAAQPTAEAREEAAGGQRPPREKLLTDISGEKFRKRERLADNSNFLRVQRTGRSFQLKHMRLQVVRNDDIEDATCTRIGIVTAKKSFRRAVDRNLMRRRLRHIYRTNKELWPERVDIVVVMNSTLEASYADLLADMVSWSESMKAIGTAELTSRKQRSSSGVGGATLPVRKPPQMRLPPPAGDTSSGAGGAAISVRKPPPSRPLPPQDGINKPRQRARRRDDPT